ncbi:MAG: CPBP family intramembrane glutamic endopeptidase [Pseudomonadota bacterium]
MQATLTARSRLQLWLEFALLYIGIPVLMLMFLGQYSLFTTVWLLAAASMFLLWRTPGFKVSKLWQGFKWRDLRILAAFSLLTVICTFSTVLLVVPERFLDLPINRSGLWIMIMLLYPPLSAWPQEIIFRTLFFERYGVLFANAKALIATNAVVFGFGHLFFQNPITIIMTGAAGAFMGWAYYKSGSLWLAWLLHSVGGMIVFTSGLGIFFYHGAIGATP